MDYEAILKIKFVDQLWRSITSEISFEDQNPRYHLEDLDWRSISVTLDICSEDPIDGFEIPKQIFLKSFFWRKAEDQSEDWLWRSIVKSNLKEQLRRAIFKIQFVDQL
jgi:hypothetical protein